MPTLKKLSQAIAMLCTVTTITPSITTAATPAKLTDKPGIDLAFFDKSALPCTDFYRYAIGNWQDKSPVPADKARWGAFDEIETRNRLVMLDVLKAAAKSSAKPNTVRRQVGDFFVSGMSSQNKEAALNRATDIARSPQYAKSLADAVGLLHRQGTPAGFGFAVRQDQRDSTRYIAQIFQGGLGLPEREYYFAKDERSAKQRAMYVAHIAAVLRLAGASQMEATEQSANIMALETKLAEAAMTRIEARDPDKTYNLMTLPQLQALAPEFDWATFFNVVGAANVGDINVGQPNFFKAFATLAATTPKATWDAYTRWHTLRTLAPQMGAEFEKENFAFYGKELTGVEEMESREKRVVATIDRTMGEALGQLYVAKAFPPASKAKALELVANVRTALRERIAILDWMSDATKREATTKLDAMVVKIGYPDKWKDYSAVVIKPDDYLGNVMRATEAEFQRQVARLGKPIDRSVWGMSPPTVNAYYSSGLNEIVFPAGILQSPFFDAKADDASNYGGIGMVIGHELTHGFDDRGRKFDAKGNRRDWWTAEDAARYTAKADAIAKQYDAFQPLPNMNINGKFTLGENIADFGGLRVAYLGLQKAEAAKPSNLIDGKTASQRFFINYAQSWRQNIREAELRRRLMTDSHSPARFRVLGPLGNLAEFGKAFGCKAGDAMMRAEAEQITIW
jgi:putative endopeptidase